MSKETGASIKEARTAAGLSQKALAEKVDGLSASSLGKAERGEKELTPEQLTAIAEATGVAPETLMEAPEAEAVSDEELLELLKSADPETKNAAVSVLKGEKPQGGDMMSMFAGMMGGAGGEGGEGGDAMAGMMNMFGGMMGGGAGGEGGEGAEGGDAMAGMMNMFGGMMGGAAGGDQQNAEVVEEAPAEEKPAKKSKKK